MPESTPLQNPTAYFYAWDHLGTVRLVTDAAGAPVDVHDFEPYGVEIRPLQNASLNTLRYTGYERDEATGLDYAHFRFLASTMGRFMKPDNIMGNPQNPQSWNLYSYVQGNPVNFCDPTGHEPKIYGIHEVSAGNSLKYLLGFGDGDQDEDGASEAGQVDKPTVFVYWNDESGPNQSAGLSSEQTDAAQDEIRAIYFQAGIKVVFRPGPIPSGSTPVQNGI